MRLEKGTEVLSNEERNSLMVYNKMQFKIKFSLIPADTDFQQDILKHLKASLSSVSMYGIQFSSLVE